MRESRGKDNKNKGILQIFLQQHFVPERGFSSVVDVDIHSSFNALYDTPVGLLPENVVHGQAWARVRRDPKGVGAKLFGGEVLVVVTDVAVYDGFHAIMALDGQQPFQNIALQLRAALQSVFFHIDDGNDIPAGQAAVFDEILYLRVRRYVRLEVVVGPERDVFATARALERIVAVVLVRRPLRGLRNHEIHFPLAPVRLVRQFSSGAV